MVSTESLPVFLCEECADPLEVRTYCVRCKTRLRLTVQEAKDLFEATGTGIRIKRSGLAMVYPNGCPSCSESSSLPIIFQISDLSLIARAVI